MNVISNNYTKENSLTIIIFTLSIQTLKLLTIIALNFENPHFLPVDVSKFDGYVTNSVDPDQRPRSAASDLGLHCLLKPVFYTI